MPQIKRPKGCEGSSETEGVGNGAIQGSLAITPPRFVREGLDGHGDRERVLTQQAIFAPPDFAVKGLLRFLGKNVLAAGIAVLPFSLRNDHRGTGDVGRQRHLIIASLLPKARLAAMRHDRSRSSAAAFEMFLECNWRNEGLYNKIMIRKPLSMKPSERSHGRDGGKISMRQIRTFARQVADRFHPEKIILFGSYAYGVPTRDSDVDILVVMPTRSQIEQAVRIRLAFTAPFPMDLIVRTPDRLRQQLAEGSSFLREVVSRGKVLYEKRPRRRGFAKRKPTTSPPAGSDEAPRPCMIKFVSTANSARRNISRPWWKRVD